MSRTVLPFALLVLVSGCGPSEESRRRDEGRRVVAAFDDAMALRGTERAPAVARLRALRVTAPLPTRARDACATMLESLAAASELQTRLEPMATRLEELAHADASVPVAERSEVLSLYALATRSADAAAAAIEPCTRAIDALRTDAIGSH